MAEAAWIFWVFHLEDGGHMVAFTKFLQCVKYIILDFTLAILLYSLIPGIVPIYTHVFTVFALYTPSHTLSPPPPLHTGTTSHLQTIPDFVKEKKK
jgi:hypothetical protein